jgi:hypothetical protein
MAEPNLLRSQFYDQLTKEMSQRALVGQRYSPYMPALLPEELRQTYAANEERSRRASDETFRNQQAAEQKNQFESQQKSQAIGGITSAATTLGAAYMLSNAGKAGLAGKAAIPSMSPSMEAGIQGGEGMSMPTAASSGTVSGSASGATPTAVGGWALAAMAGKGLVRHYAPEGRDKGEVWNRENTNFSEAQQKDIEEPMSRGLYSGVAPLSWLGEHLGINTPGVSRFFNNFGKETSTAMTKVFGCIIVTACTNEDSEEVNIAREYRDKYLSSQQLRGYYIIAEKVVPFINSHLIAKLIIKKLLVDNLIEYGRHELGMTDKSSYLSKVISKTFLGLCERVGNKRESFVRYNGEVV